MKTEHTKGPWVVKILPNGDPFIRAEDAWVENDRGPDFRREIMSDEEYDEKLADANRIVACVNACEGLTNEEIEKWVPVLTKLQLHNI